MSTPKLAILNDGCGHNSSYGWWHSFSNGCGHSSCNGCGHGFIVLLRGGCCRASTCPCHPRRTPRRNRSRCRSTLLCLYTCTTHHIPRTTYPAPHTTHHIPRTTYHAREDHAREDDAPRIAVYVRTTESAWEPQIKPACIRPHVARTPLVYRRHLPPKIYY